MVDILADAYAKSALPWREMYPSADSTLISNLSALVCLLMRRAGGGGGGTMPATWEAAQHLRRVGVADAQWGLLRSKLRAFSRGHAVRRAACRHLLLVMAADALTDRLAFACRRTGVHDGAGSRAGAGEAATPWRA